MQQSKPKLRTLNEPENVKVLNTSIALLLCFITFYYNEFYLVTAPYIF